MPWRRSARAEKLAIYIALFARRIRTMAAGLVQLQPSWLILCAYVFLLRQPRHSLASVTANCSSVRYADSRGKCQMRTKTQRLAIKIGSIVC
jgi:hypothetical protein